MKVLRVAIGHFGDCKGKIDKVINILRSAAAEIEVTVRSVDLSSEELRNELVEGRADVTVYSSSDINTGKFLQEKSVAIPSRGDTRNIAVFNAGILANLRDDKNIRIVVSSGSVSMTITFLEKALPQSKSLLNVEFVETEEHIGQQLQLLRDNAIDGLVLPADTINCLLTSDQKLQEWWPSAMWMILPLIECVPALGQGAIVIEANPGDNDVLNLIQAVNDEKLLNDFRTEAQIASRYKNEAVKELGVTTIYYRDQPAYYAAGIDKDGDSFEEWFGLPTLDASGKKLFSATDFMKSFFAYTDIELPGEIPTPIAFVANYKAVQISGVSELLKEKKIWASGTRTWFELAKAGYWVWGSADALGLEFLHPLFETKLVNISKENICIVTHDDAASRWQKKGWKAVGTYGLAPKNNPAIEEQIKEADIVFWTSYNQYELYKDLLKKDVVHTCASGETASLLQAQGLNPVIFPNIKAFSSWRKKSAGP